MSKYSILKPIAHDLAQEYGVSADFFIMVGDRVLENSLTAENGFSFLNYFPENITADALVHKLLADTQSDDTGELSRFLHYDNGIAVYELPCRDGILTVCADPLYDFAFAYSSEEKNELFEREFLDNAEIIFVTPKNPRLEKYCASNAADCMHLALSPMQNFYSCDVKTALCYAYAHGKKSYVLKDGGRCIGLTVTDMENDNGIIDYAAIDKKHQLKGYGKLLINSVLDMFRDAGCVRAQIAVHEHNERAQHVYEGAGFTERERNGDSILMEMLL